MLQYIENIVIYKRYRNISKNSIFFSTIQIDMIYRYRKWYIDMSNHY